MKKGWFSKKVSDLNSLSSSMPKRTKLDFDTISPYKGMEVIGEVTLTWNDVDRSDSSNHKGKIQYTIFSGIIDDILTDRIKLSNVLPLDKIFSKLFSANAINTWECYRTADGCFSSYLNKGGYLKTLNKRLIRVRDK